MNYALGFSVSNLRPKSFQKILNNFESLDKGWNAPESQLAKIGIIGKTFATFDKFRNYFDFVRYTVQMKKAKVEFISFLDKRYPSGLKKLSDPPIGLFCKGNLELLGSAQEIASPDLIGIAMTSIEGHSGEKMTPESENSKNWIPDQVRNDPTSLKLRGAKQGVGLLKIADP